MEESLVYNLMSLSYSQILKSNIELSKITNDRSYTVDILSNITINPIKEILEYTLRTISLTPVVRIGNYDNIVQDTFTIEKTNLVIIFYELINLKENLHIVAELLDPDEVSNLIAKAKQDIDLIFHNLSGKPLVFFNTFSSLPFTGTNHYKSNLRLIEDELNKHLLENAPKNTHLINLNQILAGVGINNAYDKKKFIQYKSLYSIEFFKRYTDSVLNPILKSAGKLKKALIFDCDNTLWKGVIGEDGMDGIDMSMQSKTGKHFHLVQEIARMLSSRGVLIALCTKNNPGEIEQVLQHKDMVLDKDSLVAIKVNWNNKNENLQQLAKELNIGLDSFVFIDDSFFEVNLVKSSLPQVLTFQVPLELSDYPSMILDISQKYFNLEPLEEDIQKVKLYKQQAQRNEALGKINDIDTYLSTLQTSIKIAVNRKDQVGRVSQLSQKTNQFNLTTVRYSEVEIEQFMDDPSSSVVTIDVSDKFGDSGLTGVCILKEDLRDRSVIEVDSLLLSCRVLGRKVEDAFINYIIMFCRASGYKTLRSKYVKTNKNGQVENFYLTHQFETQNISETVTEYLLDLGSYEQKEIDFIKIIQD